jgi:hypothetical protein
VFVLASDHERALLLERGKTEAADADNHRLGKHHTENATLRRELANVADALPNTARYLDPPDGGDVPIAEQVRRMGRDLAEALAENAAVECHNAELGGLLANVRRELAKARAAVHGLTQDGLELQRELAEARDELQQMSKLHGTPTQQGGSISQLGKAIPALFRKQLL